MAAAARHYAVLAVILAAALAIRVALAATNGLWLDEGLTVALAAWPARDLLALPVDPNPATIYLLQKLLPPDAPLLAIRAFAIAAGTASVALAYALGRLAFGRGAGLLAAALLAVWTVHVDYSLEARAYILLFLSTLAASTGVAAYAREDRPRLARAGLALFAAGNVAAWYAHPTAAFWIAASSLILAGVALARRTPRAAIEAASAFAAMALAALPSLPRLVAQQAQGVDFTWLAQAAPREALRQAADVMGPMGLWTNPIASGGDLQRLAILAAVALVAAWAAWPRRREIARLLAARPWAAALIAAYLLMPLAVWATGLVATPIFMRRTILFAIPGALLVLALAAAGRRIPGLVLVAVFALSTLLYGGVRQKEDWRGAAAYLAAHVRPGDAVAVCIHGAYPALRYHTETPLPVPVLVDDGHGLVRIEAALGSDPAWDRTYVAALQAPAFARRGYDLAARPAPRRAAAVTLAPGAALWLAEAHCGPPWRAMHAALAAVDPAPHLAWTQRTKASGPAPAVRITRHTATRPVTLAVEAVGP
jgi:hypothetical protein